MEVNNKVLEQPLTKAVGYLKQIWQTRSCLLFDVFDEAALYGKFSILKTWIGNGICAFYSLTRWAIFREHMIYLSLFSDGFCVSDGERERSLALNGKHCFTKHIQNSEHHLKLGQVCNERSYLNNTFTY